MILFWLALAWLSGASLAAAGLAYVWPLAAAAGAGTAVGLLLAGRTRPALAVLFLCPLLLGGLARYELVRPPQEPEGVALLNDRDEVELRGVIVSSIEERERSQRFTLRVDAYREAGVWRPTHGSVLVTARLYPRYQYGDALELSALLETPPRFDGFDYREYLARKGIVSLAAFPEITMTAQGQGSAARQLLEDARRPLSRALAGSLPEPEAALARGILLGERASIPRGVSDDFNAAGISHLVAISGYNVMLVAGLSVASLAWVLGRRRAVLVSMFLVVLFALFVGAQPSVLRAAAMALIMLGATLAGRPGSSLTAVCVAAAALVAIEPLIIADAGFQLSVAATLGIVLGAQQLQLRLGAAFETFFGRTAGSYLAENTAITASASIAVLPVLLASFGRASLVALPANLMAGFAFPLILASSALTAAAGAISVEAGRAAGMFAYLPLAWLRLVGELWAGVPFASPDFGDSGLLEASALAAVLAAGYVWLSRRQPPAAQDVEPVTPQRVGPVLALSALVLGAGVVSIAGVIFRDSNDLTVTVLDVGQGDAILVETPSGQRVLIDGGPSASKLMQELARELPRGSHRVDLVVLTHAQDDHVTGLVDLAERFDVGAVLTGPLPGASGAFFAWQEVLQRKRIAVHEARAGDWIDLGDGLRLDVLGPPPQPVTESRDDLNNNSVVLRLVYDQISFLLTGDLAAEGEVELLRGGADLRSTVLKLGHHGSDSSSTSPFLAAVAPSYAVISVGVENSSGHPSPTTQLRLAGVPLLRTDRNGSVRFETDGRRLRTAFDRGGFSLVERSSGRADSP